MIGKFVAHYKILEKLGEGGMGVVYQAEDTKLKRAVALKFLPAELTKDARAKARFAQEAQAAAALDHPNICAVFEIGESAGVTYIVMPYVRGRSLKEKIATRPFSVEEALDIAGQVGEGLKEAHERGIIHRDIKPANIMLTEKGQAKIMDFGLAKLTAAADVTQTLGIVGTIAYMSPEQARGEAVDHRTDIWSFGAMVYEILTGRMPFGRKHDRTLVYSILNDAPEPPSRLRSDIPRPVEQLVLKALEKDTLRRYQNISELLKDLEAARISDLSVAAAEKSIIVLPFENISPDPEQEYFCDGMTEEIIADLSRVHDLLVISRSSAMTFKGTKKTIPEIARAVNARYVLEGSVRKAGNSLRITAQLIDSSTDAHLWAEKYSGILDDVFDIQEKVSRKIVEALKGSITPRDRQQLSARPSFPNIAVYEAYSRARYEFWKSERESTVRALRLLEKAIELLGEHPLLVSGVGAIHWQLYHFRGDTNEAHLTQIEECARKLFAVEPGSAPGHRLRSYLALHAGDSMAAIRHLQRAAEGDPGDTETLLWLSYLLTVHAGRPEHARPVAEKWIAIDPAHPIGQLALDLAAWMRGDLESATRGMEEGYRLEPDSQVRAFYLGHLFAWTGRHEESLRLAEKMFHQDPEDTMGQALRFVGLSLHGRAEEAKNAVSPAVEESIWMDFHLPWVMAEGYSLLGEKDEALRWLERAVEKGIFNYPVLNELDPLLAGVRGDPRFRKLMERVKHEWENFEP